MIHIFELLSGDIPGGFVLLLAALIFANLTVHFLHTSGLTDPQKILKRRIIVNVLVVATYTFLFFYTKTPAPPDRIVVLPTLSEDKKFVLNAKSLKLADLFEQNVYHLKGRFLVHKWQWLYETMDHEQAKSYDNWLETGSGLKPFLLIKSTYKNPDNISIEIVFSDEKVHPKVFDLPIKSWQEVIKRILAESELPLKSEQFNVDSNNAHLDTRLLIAQNKFNDARLLLKEDSTVTAQVLLAELDVKEGLKFKYNYAKARYVSTVNPDFEKAKLILHRLVKNKVDQPPVAMLLGRMAIREQEFENAEVYLKKAFIDEPTNARVYYMFSLMLPSRLEELGFENRKDVLKKAIQLDPGYTDAVYDLANEYYITGTGSEGGAGTQFALNTLEDYRAINKSDPKILSLLATLYIKTARYEKAESIYSDLGKRFPGDSNVQYNLGIVSYSKGDYKTALNYFMEAIKKDQNLDAYLYTAITYEMMGDKQSALKYYQDRVRLKTGDDDKYAQEAMAGIRKIREEMDVQNNLKKE